MELGDKQRRKVSAPGDAVSVFIQNLRPGNSLKARFNGLRSSGKLQFSGQTCYDGTTVHCLVIAETLILRTLRQFSLVFYVYVFLPLILINKISHL